MNFGRILYFHYLLIYYSTFDILNYSICPLKSSGQNSIISGGNK